MSLTASFKSLLPVLILSFLLLAFTLPFKTKTFVFDWDQASDFQAVETIAHGKPLLIGPRVTSDQGFFLAPWHYYFMLPFYFLTGGSVYTGFWAALAVHFLLVLTVYLIIKQWFGIFAAFSTALFFASPVNLTAWGFMYVPLLSFLFFYLCLRTLHHPRFLPVLFFLLGIGCTTYAVFYALVLPFVYVLFRLIKDKKPTPKSFLLGIFLFFLPYLPLLIFDLRHQFLNLNNLLHFAGSQKGAGEAAFYFLRVFFRALDTFWIGVRLSPAISLALFIFSLAVLIFGAITIFPKNKIFVFIWLFSSLIPLAFYHGAVSEYYYAPVVLLLPLFISVLFSQKIKYGKPLLFIFVSTLLFFRHRHLSQNFAGITLADKLALVAKMEELQSSYSISYAFKLGEDSGYDFLFNRFGKHFVPDGSAPLYTITYQKNPLPVSGQSVASTDKLLIYRRGPESNP